MGRSYDTSSLKEIGNQCSKRLPPASTVQAMFTYMVNRDADVQARFEGAIFEIAKAEEEATKHSERLSSLEAQLKDVQNRAINEEIEQRISTSRVRTDALATRMNEHFTRLGDYGRRLTELENVQSSLTAAREEEKKQLASLSASIEAAEAQYTELQDGKQDLNTLRDEVSALQTEVKHLETSSQAAEQVLAKLRANLQAAEQETASLKTEVFDLKSQLAKADSEIQMLFDERDALMQLHVRSTERHDALETQLDTLEVQSSERMEKVVAHCNEQIEQVKGLVRALTLQKTSPTLNQAEAAQARSSSVHFCPLTTKNGENVDLVVPKGKGFVSLGKEEIKAFTPGKPWAS